MVDEVFKKKYNHPTFWKNPHHTKNAQGSATRQIIFVELVVFISEEERRQEKIVCQAANQAFAKAFELLEIQLV